MPWQVADIALCGGLFPLARLLHHRGGTIGRAAVRRIAKHGTRRHQLGIILERKGPAPLGCAWEALVLGDQKVRDMTNCIWSPRLKANLGFALIASDIAAGTTIQVARPDGMTEGQLVSLPFL